MSSALLLHSTIISRKETESETVPVQRHHHRVGDLFIIYIYVHIYIFFKKSSRESNQNYYKKENKKTV